MNELTYEDWWKNPTPRMMWVWDGNERDKVIRKVIYFIENKKAHYPIIALTSDGNTSVGYKYCAEIEKQRRMTNKELSRWLREKPTREYKYSNSIENRVYSTYTYDEDAEEEEVRKDVVIREDDGEWREPLVEVEE